MSENPTLILHWQEFLSVFVSETSTLKTQIILKVSLSSFLFILKVAGVDSL